MRQHILLTAGASLAERGLGISLRDVARRAGVGVATVHRHFGTRDDLIAAALADAVTACSADIDSVLAEEDPRVAIAELLNRVARRVSVNRALQDLLFSRHPAVTRFASARAYHAQAFTSLVARAQDAGVLRPGTTLADFHLALTALTSLRALPAAKAIGAGDRLSALLVHGLLADTDDVDGRPRAIGIAQG